MDLTVGISAGDVEAITNESIQAAVDRVVEAGGGTVALRAGRYEMHDAIRIGEPRFDIDAEAENITTEVTP